MKKSLLGLDSWIAAAEEVSLQTASEGGKRRCRRDVLHAADSSKHGLQRLERPGRTAQSEKNLLSSNTSSTCPYNMVNFGPVAAEILTLVWGTPANFNGFRVLAALLHVTPALGVSQTLRH